MKVTAFFKIVCSTARLAHKLRWVTTVFCWTMLIEDTRGVRFFVNFAPKTEISIENLKNIPRRANILRYEGRPSYFRQKTDSTESARSRGFMDGKIMEIHKSSRY